jgi:hypothetical protein
VGGDRRNLQEHPEAAAETRVRAVSPDRPEDCLPAPEVAATLTRPAGAPREEERR